MQASKDTNASRYLDLLKRCLTYSLWPEDHRRYDITQYGSAASRLLRRTLQHQLQRRGLEVMQVVPYDASTREYGRDWPPSAHTMIGMRRLESLQECIETIIAEDVPGDLIETGVWRGGASMFMRAVLAAHGVTDRRIWVADSFAGLPPPDVEKYPEDSGSRYHLFSEVLSVSLDEVQANFARYGLLDEQVCFLKGWFKDTLPRAPIDALALARLDGDMYESTMEALVHLYPRLSPGGYLIVDDYGLEDGLCKRAVDTFRAKQHIDSRLIDIDGHGVLWRKQAEESVAAIAGSEVVFSPRPTSATSRA